MELFEEVEYKRFSNYGIYEVGKDIDPGEYKLTQLNQERFYENTQSLPDGYYSIYSDYAMKALVKTESFNNEQYVSLSEVIYLF